MSLHRVLKRRTYTQCCHTYGWMWICASPRNNFHFSVYKPIHRGIQPVILSSYMGLRLLSLSSSNFHIFSKLTSFLANKIVKDDDQVKKKEVTGSTDSMKEEQLAALETQGDTNLNNSGRTLKFKLSSLFNSLRPSSQFRMSTPVSSALKENPSANSVMDKRLTFHKEIVDSSERFLKQYDNDLDTIIKKVTPQPKKKKKIQAAQPKKEKQPIKMIKYHHSPDREREPVFLSSFEETKKILQKLDIPTDELPYYPVVQSMKEEDICYSVNEVKRQGIHMIFSLSLISHVHSEKCRLESPLPKKKSSKKRTKSVTTLKEARVYLELCSLLEKPDLDILHLLGQLAELEQYFNIFTVHKRVKKLQALGATPTDILSNLEILRGYELFDRKVQLYSKTPRDESAPFPIQLFSAKNLTSFKEQLGMGQEVNEIAKLLGVSVADFQACWGYKYMRTSELQHKIRMCLSAGISGKDIFNNLELLHKFPVDKCHAVTSSFRNLRLPASVFVLRHMEEAVELNGNGCRNNKNNNNNNNNNNANDNNSNVNNNEQHISDSQPHEQDWTGEPMVMGQSSMEMLKLPSPLNVRKNAVSSKKRRKAIYALIEFVLQLDDSEVSAMYECDINTDTVNVLDVRKNLDYLLSLKYTEKQIATCPLILAHPHKDLVTVIREAETLLLTNLYSSSSSSVNSQTRTSHHLSRSSLSFLEKSVSDDQRKQDLAVKTVILNNPTLYFNMLQYLLEKNKNFSMASVDSERLVGFLDV